MKLTYDQIKSVVFGIDHSWTDDGCIRFQRCSDKTAKDWGSLRWDFAHVAVDPAGIRLDFHTDSQWVAILPTAPAPFDFLVDDMLVRTCSWDSYENTEGWVKLPLPEGEHRVSILFPQHSNVNIGIRELELSDGASLKPHTYDCKILFFGDSITHGTGASSSYLSYAWRVSRALNADCRNLAVGGTFFAPGAFPHDLNFDPDIVIIAYGTNDWGFFSGPDRLELRSREFLDLVCQRFAGKNIFGISPLWRINHKEIRSVGTFEACCDIVKNAHRSHGITLIDGATLVPHQTQFFTDGLHPNDNGHDCYAQNLLLQLRPYLSGGN